MLGGKARPPPAAAHLNSRQLAPHGLLQLLDVDALRVSRIVNADFLHLARLGDERQIAAVIEWQRVHIARRRVKVVIKVSHRLKAGLLVVAHTVIT